MVWFTVLSLLLGHLLSAAALVPVAPNLMPRRSRDSILTLSASGRGMGMGTKTKPDKKKNKKSTGGFGGGGGSVKGSKSFDVNASVVRLEKRYDELMTASAKQLARESEEEGASGLASTIKSGDDADDTITREFVVTVRVPDKQAVHDWVPVAQLCLACPEAELDDTDTIPRTAVSAYCRELSLLAGFGAPVFATVARNEMQYGVEAIESFHKFVYERVVEGEAEKIMSKSQARTVLGLEQSSDLEKSTIKGAYRNLSFQLHPDRFEGSEDECEEAAKKFENVKLAYEALTSGVRETGSSWYESLGGRERTQFRGPIDLISLSKAGETLEQRKTKAAIVGLDPDLVQTFVARNLRSE